MKFEIIMANEADKRGKVGAFDRTIFEMEGDLDSVKTYIKLAAGKNFKWGSVTILDKVATGEVNRWMVQKNRATGQMALHTLSFHDVDHEININALYAIYDDDVDSQPMNKELGGGKF